MTKKICLRVEPEIIHPNEALLNRNHLSGPLEKDYFSGTHDPNRIRFTTWCDIVLEPGQRGGPLNYFIYSYVEVDGVLQEDRTLRFGFRDF